MVSSLLGPDPYCVLVHQILIIPRVLLGSRVGAITITEAMQRAGSRLLRPLLCSFVPIRRSPPFQQQVRRVSDLAQLPSKTGSHLVPLDCPPSAIACGFNASHARLHWPSPPRNVLVVIKQHDRPALHALYSAANWLATTHPTMKVLVEVDTHAELVLA